MWLDCDRAEQEVATIIVCRRILASESPEFDSAKGDCRLLLVSISLPGRAGSKRWSREDEDRSGNIMGVVQIGRNNAVSSSSARMRFPSRSVSPPQSEYCVRTPHRMGLPRGRDLRE